MEITSKVTTEFIKIYFDGILHLLLKHKDIVGIQSWKDYSGTVFIIEFNFARGHSFTSEYNNQERWQKMLGTIEELF